MTTINVYRRDNVWFAETETFPVIGIGDTPDRAVEDLLHEFHKGGFEWV